MSELLEVALNVPLNKYFDYKIDAIQTLPPIGSRVLVPFGRQQKVGIVCKHKINSDIPADKLKNIIAVLDHDQLSHDLMQLYQWCHQYYCHSIGEIIVGTLPKKIREILKKKVHHLSNELFTSPEIKIVTNEFKILNQEQQQALQQISLTSFQVSLLDGITGSGKTEVYMHLIKEIIIAGKQVLVLVPEIGLTPQTEQRFSARFPNIVTTIHSELTETEKLKSWQSAHTSSAKIILGTRSAVFADIPNLGAIIIDEEHDQSFKQQEGFRYHARSVAIIRAKLKNIPIILGSATPATDTLYNAINGKYQHLRLAQRAGNAAPPSIELIDMRDSNIQSCISDKLQKHIQEHLDKKQQVLLFLNRRGYSQVVYCNHCGWTCCCKNCDAKMTLHQKINAMRCHHCNYMHNIPTACENCKHPDLIFLGQGTEQIEESINALFNKYRIIRLDSDTMQHKGKLQTTLQQIHNDEVDIIIGTQMIAKGHHFKNCGMVAVLNMDQCLFSANFRNIEYGGQLLLQIAGRSGRENNLGKVYIQTECPTHKYLQPLINNDYHGFYNIIMAERKEMHIPPYTSWAYIQTRSKNEKTAMNFLNKIKLWMRQNIKIKCEYFGPVAATMARKADWYQAQLCIQATNKSELQKAYTQLMSSDTVPANTKTLRWYLDVDPIN
jgi:primosomal protein N' (replication factor Y)